MKKKIKSNSRDHVSFCRLVESTPHEEKNGETIDGRNEDPHADSTEGGQRGRRG